jgi:hypothetical protein
MPHSQYVLIIRNRTQGDDSIGILFDTDHQTIKWNDHESKSGWIFHREGRHLHLLILYNKPQPNIRFNPETRTTHRSSL